MFRQFTVMRGVRGYIVQIGCQMAGFSTVEELNSAIVEYTTDPEAAEEKYYAGHPTEQCRLGPSCQQPTKEVTSQYSLRA